MLQNARQVDNTMFNPSSIQAIISMLNIVLDTTIFHVPQLNKFFKQIHGVAMGNNSSPTVVNLTLAYYELKWNNQTIVRSTFQTGYLFMKRYIDDLIGVKLSMSEFKLNRITFTNQISDLKKYYPDSLQLNYTGFKSFLDLKFVFVRDWENGGKKMEITTHQKELNLYQYTLKSSVSPKSILKGIIYGEYIRYAKICTTFDLWREMTMKLDQRLVNRGYSLSLIKSFTKELNYFTLKRKYSKPFDMDHFNLKISQVRSKLFLAEGRPPIVWRVIFSGYNIPYRRIINQLCSPNSYNTPPEEVIICNIRMPNLLELLQMFRSKFLAFKQDNPQYR